MSILEFNKQKEEKQIEVFYNWGNPELTFRWGCVQAQEVFAERGLRVFYGRIMWEKIYTASPQIQRPST